MQLQIAAKRLIYKGEILGSEIVSRKLFKTQMVTGGTFWYTVHVPGIGYDFSRKTALPHSGGRKTHF
jgi:hypothetical protein